VYEIELAECKDFGADTDSKDLDSCIVWHEILLPSAGGASERSFHSTRHIGQIRCIESDGEAMEELKRTGAR
jgi:hypothetical protein